MSEHEDPRPHDQPDEAPHAARDPEEAGTDAARGEETEREEFVSTENLDKRVADAERRADEARGNAEEAARREAETGGLAQDAGGEAPEVDQPEETPQRQ